MAANLIVERIQRDLVLVTFRVMLLLLLMMMDAAVVMMVMKMIVVVGLEARRATLFTTDHAATSANATGLDDAGKVMTVGELLVMMILQVRREFVGAFR